MGLGAAAGVAAAGAVASGVMQSSAAGAASKAQQNASKLSIENQQAMYKANSDLLDPYIQNGTNVNSILVNNLQNTASPIKMDQATLEQTPGYQFTLNQGLQGVASSAAARGLGVSGAALKGAAQYATGLASNTYQQQFNNELTSRQNTYNQLLGVSSQGLKAGAALAGVGQETANNVSSNLGAIGNAQAAGAIGTAAGYGNALTGVTGAASNYLTQTTLQNQALNQPGGQGIYGDPWSGGAGNVNSTANQNALNQIQF